MPRRPAYRPEPFDPTQVSIEPHIQALVEQLAELNHDVWAFGRQREGWRYGKQSSNARKLHPGLVPYEQLSESEKEYDRNAVLATIKGMLALGYRIVPPDSAQLKQDQELVASVAALRTFIDSSDVPELVRCWNDHDAAAWALTADLYILLGSRFVRRGEPLLAYEVVAEGLAYWPNNERLRQIMGLALARSGATRRANAMAVRLRRSVTDPAVIEDAIALLGRTHKDLALDATDESLRRWHLAQALDAYADAFRLSRGSYSAINAAVMSLLLGQQEDAERFARDAQRAALAELRRSRKNGGTQYWQLATLGEAALVLGRTADATKRYQEALQHAAHEYGDIASMRRQARLIAGCRDFDAAWLEHLLRLPPVVVFAGDAVGDGGLTEGAAPWIAGAVEARLRELGAGFGFSAAACGSEILFLEALTRLNGHTHVVLPCAQEQYAAACVRVAGKGHWLPRFDQVLRHASEVVIASTGVDAEDTFLREYCDQLLLGLARVQSRSLETELVPMVVCADPDGDTRAAATLRHWQRLGMDVEVITPPVRRRQRPRTARARQRPADGVDQRTGAILFADVVGFSRLASEVDVLRFCREFLGAVASLIDAEHQPPLVRNTWGDGLYLVFQTVRQAGLFALRLSETVAATAWTEKQLPADMNVRVALHAGPVLSFVDPVTRQPTLSGKHVMRAARMEPVTPPGLVYASREFAALAAAENVTEFTCEPVGRVRLDKSAGLMPLFVVQPVTRSAAHAPAALPS